MYRHVCVLLHSTYPVWMIVHHGFGKSIMALSVRYTAPHSLHSGGKMYKQTSARFGSYERKSQRIFGISWVNDAEIASKWMNIIPNNRMPSVFPSLVHMPGAHSSWALQSHHQTSKSTNGGMSQNVRSRWFNARKTPKPDQNECDKAIGMLCIGLIVHHTIVCRTECVTCVFWRGPATNMNNKGEINQIEQKQRPSSRWSDHPQQQIIIKNNNTKYKLSAYAHATYIHIFIYCPSGINASMVLWLIACRIHTNYIMCIYLYIWCATTNPYNEKI